MIKPPPPEPLEQVENAWHLAGDVAWLDMLLVPPRLRRQGVGSAAYQRWERDLPVEVCLVRIFAADTGGGPSDGFWLRQGFAYCYDVEGLPYEHAQMMRKGVNGHPTPPPIPDDEASA